MTPPRPLPDPTRWPHPLAALRNFVTRLCWRAVCPRAERTPEDIARRFHDTYERLAPDFGYRTRRESAVPWDEVPENNRRLMIATVTEVLSDCLSEEHPRRKP